MKRRHGINKSKTNRIKSDNASQNFLSDENIDQPERNGIELSSFESPSSSISPLNDEAPRFYESTSEETSLVSQEHFSDSLISQQHTISNTYCSISTL